MKGPLCWPSVLLAVAAMVVATQLPLGQASEVDDLERDLKEAKARVAKLNAALGELALGFDIAPTPVHGPVLTLRSGHPQAAGRRWGRERFSPPRICRAC